MSAVCTDGDVALSIRGLTKAFGDVVAVDGLSLDVRRGEVFGFLGPNGAGKTTTIGMVCGLLRPDSGEIVIGGRSAGAEPRAARRRLGLCPQDLVIWETLTCLEQLEYAARIHDVPRSAARRRALETLEAVGLGDRRNAWAGALSGGMKRRLNIALALVHEPELLILDEPQAGLDPQSRILVREHVRSLASRTTVVVTTHDMDEADRLSDRIAVIDHGRLLVLDTAERLKSSVGEGDILEIEVDGASQEELRRLRGALPGGGDGLEGLAGVRVLPSSDAELRLVGPDVVLRLPEVLDRITRRGAAVRDVTVRHKTLEDVFIALTGRGLRE